MYLSALAPPSSKVISQLSASHRDECGRPAGDCKCIEMTLEV